MVTRKEEAVSEKEPVDKMAVQETEVTSVEKAISPLERWTMVAEAAYYLAQKRGFVGGNPMEDWIEAEKEIDAEYTIDYSKIMGLFNPSEMIAQLGKVFGSVPGQPDLHLDSVLESQRENIEALTNANKRVFQDVREMVERQTQVFKKMMDQAISPMKSKARSAASKTAVEQAELIRLGLEKTLVSMRDTAESVAKANAEALDTANRRVAENISALKQLTKKIEPDDSVLIDQG